MQRNDERLVLEEVIADIVNDLSSYIDARGYASYIETPKGKSLSMWGVNFTSYWLRDHHLTLARVGLAADTILRLDACNGDIEKSLQLIQKVIDDNRTMELNCKNRPYATENTLKWSYLHRVLLDAEKKLIQLRKQELLRVSSSVCARPASHRLG